MELYIGRCIESILSQSYQQFEIILVNDGSTDTSLEICENYSKSDSRIIVINQANSGPSVARNNGIKKAEGEFIQFIDSDDFLEPRAIENMIEAICDTDIVIAPYFNVHEQDSSIKKNLIKHEFQGVYEKEQFILNFGEIVRNEMFNYIWNKLYRAELIKNRTNFSKYIKIGEDMIFNLDCFEISNRITVIQTPVYNHIWYNAESIKKKYHPDLFEMRKIINKRTIEFLEKNNAYSGFNKKIVDALYARKISGCFMNVIRARDSLNFKDRIQMIRDIITDQSVHDIIGVFNNAGFNQKILGILIKLGAARTIYQLYRIKSKKINSKIGDS